MSETDLIYKVYEESFRNAYVAFFNAYTDAQGDGEGEDDAKRRFQAGITHARHVRDLAISLIPE